MHEWLSVLSGILMIAGFVPYIWTIWKGKTQPAKATWLIWATLDSVTLAGMYAADATNGLIIGATCGSWIVFLLSLKHGIPGWKWEDSVCLAGTFASLMLWQATNDPLTAIILCQTVMWIGACPTIQSVWKKPERENPIAWVIGEAACVVAVVAIPRFTVQDATQPINFLIVNTVITALVLPLRNMVRKRPAQESCMRNPPRPRRKVNWFL